MTDMFRLPEFAHDRPDAGRGSRSLGLYRVLQHKSVGRRVPQGIYFQGYDVPLDLNPDPPPMPTQEASHLLSLSRLTAAVSAAGRKLAGRPAPERHADLGRVGGRTARGHRFGSPRRGPSGGSVGFHSTPHCG